MATPLMKQYLEIKAQHQDCVLFFRMGDFYELFDQDAVLASKILGITLTKRNNGGSGATPLCGFPYHAAERYVPKMVAAGHKVAICEQVEDPKLAKGIVKRDVVEIITAGTSMSENNLEAKSNNYLCGLFWNKRYTSISLATIDISTGQFSVVNGELSDIENELYRLMPKEILVSNGGDCPDFINTLVQQERILLSPLDGSLFDYKLNKELILKHFQIANLEVLGLEGRKLCVVAAGVILQYVQEQKKSSLGYIDRLDVTNLGQWMTLDPQTLRNLELLKPINHDDVKGTLNYVLDHTVTSMGARKLKYWISHPLTKSDVIIKRQCAVKELFESSMYLDGLRESLREIYDIERLTAKVGSGRANARDLQALGKSLLMTEQVGEILHELQAEYFGELKVDLGDFGDRGRYILGFLKEELPLTVREGKMIAAGASEDLDNYNEGIKDAREWLANLESREKERLGIGSLKIGYNKVFGYYIEVSRTNLDKVPETYIRKQTLANAERYITSEMKEYEARILSAESQINELEYQIFGHLRQEVYSWAKELSALAKDIASVDCIASLAKAAQLHDYTCPDIFDSDALWIEDGFHPVIKAINPGIDFICNDTEMSCQDNQIMLITGPNMAGKSTYLRQVGLIVLMAQMGGFVPAAKAKIGVVDRIFTRVGASDRLARGQSTFMVEMIETANILHHASEQSLILLDEIGRGTSTFDGLSLAWSIIEHLHQDGPSGKGFAKTLFATHYHELNTLAGELSRVQNFRITVKEQNQSLLFLRKIVPGACDSSYGIQVAEMAGLPKEVIARAKRILHRLETNRTNPGDACFEVAQPPQQDLFAMPDENEQLILKKVEALDVQSMTPVQALNFLHELKENYIKG